MATPTALPAAFTVGEVLTSADMNLLRGAFRVLQVNFVEFGTPGSNSTTTYADTGLTNTITPTSTSSKILVVAIQNGCGKEAGNSTSELIVNLVRGATELTFASGGSNGTSSVNYCGSIVLSYLDSPATVSSTTYKTQFKNYVAAASVRVQTGNTSNPKSMLVLMEISA